MDVDIPTTDMYHHTDPAIEMISSLQQKLEALDHRLERLRSASFEPETSNHLQELQLERNQVLEECNRTVDMLSAEENRLNELRPTVAEAKTRHDVFRREVTNGSTLQPLAGESFSEGGVRNPGPELHGAALNRAHLPSKPTVCEVPIPEMSPKERSTETGSLCDVVLISSRLELSWKFEEKRLRMGFFRYPFGHHAGGHWTLVFLYGDGTILHCIPYQNDGENLNGGLRSITAKELRHMRHDKVGPLILLRVGMFSTCRHYSVIIIASTTITFQCNLRRSPRNIGLHLACRRFATLPFRRPVM